MEIKHQVQSKSQFYILTFLLDFPFYDHDTCLYIIRPCLSSTVHGQLSQFLGQKIQHLILMKSFRILTKNPAPHFDENFHHVTSNEVFLVAVIFR